MINRRKFIKTASLAVCTSACKGYTKDSMLVRCPIHTRAEQVERLVNWIKRGYTGGDVNLVSNLPSGYTFGGTQRDDLKNLYWLQNCNLFAFHALRHCDGVLADKIRESYFHWYRSLFPDQIEKTEHYLALGQLPGLDAPKGRYFRAVVLRKKLDGYEIGTETHDPSSTGMIVDTDPRTLLKSGAIASWLRGNHKEAREFFDQALQLWDGRGFKNTRMDRHGAYYTRHISYALIAERILGTRIPDTIRPVMEEQLWRCQDSDGGIWTNYLPDGTLPDFAKKTNESGPLALLAYQK